MAGHWEHEPQAECFLHFWSVINGLGFFICFMIWILRAQSNKTRSFYVLYSRLRVVGFVPEIFANIMQIREIFSAPALLAARCWQLTTHRSFVRKVRSIALKTLGKERDCSQSIYTLMKHRVFDQSEREGSFLYYKLENNIFFWVYSTAIKI